MEIGKTCKKLPEYPIVALKNGTRFFWDFVKLFFIEYVNETRNVAKEREIINQVARTRHLPATN